MDVRLQSITPNIEQNIVEIAREIKSIFKQELPLISKALGWKKN